MSSSRHHRIALFLMVSTLALAGCSQSTPDGPHPISVEPPEGPNNKPTPVVISGFGFSPLVQVDYDNKKHSVVSTAFQVLLGPYALQQVNFQDRKRLTALVPAGLPGGTYDVVVVDPRGRRGELPDGFVVKEVGTDAGPDATPDGAPDATPDGPVDGPRPDLPLPVDQGPDVVKPDTVPGATVVTLAGTGQSGFKDGPAASAQFALPRGVALSGSTVYVADYANHRIRKISAGSVSTVAGSGVQGFKNGPAATAEFNFPAALSVTSSEILVADSANDVIRSIKAGQVTTLAGSGIKGFLDGVATTARFRFPQGLARAAGKIYVADTENHRIRLVQSGQVSTLAGSGVKGFLDGAAASARFNAPTGVVVSASGTLYVTDSGNNRVRAIAGGVVSTVAGSGVLGTADGAGASAQFWNPVGGALSGTKLYVADKSNHRIRILEQGIVTTLTGSYFGHKDGPIKSALFYFPSALAAPPGGKQLFVADQSNHRIRLITF